MATEPLRERLQDGDLDALLTAQFLVAWAGETGRLGWWRSTFVSRFGGLDLFSRLSPHTSPWVLLQAARETARRHDATRRAQNSDADARLTLFHLGFMQDEQADERLQHHKRLGRSPIAALPDLADFIRLPTADDDDDDDESFDRDRFEAYLRRNTARYDLAPGGRRLIGAPPSELTACVQQLLAALTPLAAEYPLPFFRRKS